MNELQLALYLELATWLRSRSLTAAQVAQVRAVLAELQP